MKKIDIYTDGACSGNPGAGGWAAILIYNGYEKEISGYDKNTTNNRMELFAIIQGLAQLKEPCEVTVYSDSAYAVEAFNKKWIENWKKNF
jgi:ribonuclease HI